MNIWLYHRGSFSVNLTFEQVVVLVALGILSTVVVIWFAGRYR